MANLLNILLFSFTVSSHTTPNELAAQWIEAIKTDNKSEVRKLIHPNCNKSKLKSEILERLVSGKLDNKYKVEFKKLSATRETLKKVFQVVPSHQLSIKYSNKEKYGFGKGFPVVKYEGKWFFVLCTKK